MIGDRQRRFVATAAERIAPQAQAAIVQLAEAHDYARDMQCQQWHFAVEIESLKALGLTSYDLRWLLSRGYIEHAREITAPNDTARKFRSPRSANFTSRSCFVLTAAGLRLTTTESVGKKVRKAA
jgi:hypothetical protein